MSILRFLLPLALLVVAGNATPKHDTLNILTKDDVDAGYRLPTGIVPTAYDIHVEPNLVEGTFTGVTKIDIRVDEPTDTITLHAGDNIVIEQDISMIEEIESEKPEDPKTLKSIKKRSTLDWIAANKNTPRGLLKSILGGSNDTVEPVAGTGNNDNGQDAKGDEDKENNSQGEDGKGDDGKGNDGKGDDSKGDDGKGDDGKGDDGKGDDSKGDDGKGDDGKGDDGKGDDGKGDDGKGDDSKGDDGKGDDGKGDEGKGDDSKGDDGKGDDGKGDDGKDDDGKGDDGKGDDGKGDDGKGDDGKDDDGKGDDGKGDDGKGDDGKGDDGKGDDSKGDDGKGDDGKGDDSKGDDGKDDDGKGEDGKGDEDDKKPPKIVKHDSDKDKNFLIIKLDKKLKKQSYRLTLTYTSKLNDANRGFFKTSYKNDDKETRYLAATHFEPLSARLAFPCWDEPALKAKFTISIKHPTDYSAVSNMPLQDKDDNAATKTSVTKFAVSPDMSTYLVAFVVSDYGNLTNDDGSFNVWTRKNALDHAHYAHDVGQKILDQFADYTKIPFSLPKMDQISIPGLAAGAMENWGLVTYQEQALLFDEDSSTTKQQQAIARIIAHEFAHQWFGNLVSPKWWTYVWLNEGFATYFSYHAMDVIEPSWRMMDQFLVTVMQGTAFVYDTIPDVRPMDYDVQAPKKVNQLFDSISYEKSGSVIRMMSHIVTPTVFKQGLRNYLKTNEKAATSDDLFKAIQKAVSESDDDDIKQLKIGPIMKSWVTQRGYPVINVTRNYGDKKQKIVITQQRFYLSTPEKRDTHKWHIPLNYATEKNPDFNTTIATSWMKPTDKKVDVKIDDLEDSQWIIFNLKQTGYYRVNYDEQNWNMIASYLDSDQFVNIDPMNRAQLIDDALNLARAGLLDYGIALNMTQYLPRETDHIVWQAVMRNMAFIEKMIAQSPEYENFQKFNAMYLSNFLQNLPLEEGDKDNHLDKLFRPQLVKSACYYGVESCNQYASKLFEDWLTDSAKYPLSVDMKDTILCAGLKEANEEVWNKTVEYYKNKDRTDEEKKAIVAALGCAKHEETLWRYLNMVLDSKSDIKDKAGIVNAVIDGSRLGVNLALDFINENYDELKKKMGGETKLTQHFTKLGKKITTTEQFGTLALLLAQKSVPASVSSDGLKNAEENVAWAKERQPEIEYWLKTKKFEEPQEDEDKSHNGAPTMSMAFIMLIVPLIATRFY